MLATLARRRWVSAVLVAASAIPSGATVSAGDCSATASPFWKNTVTFPDDPFRANGPVFTEPGWIKFTILTCDPATVYHQDSVNYAFHYEFATQFLHPLQGMTLQEFDAATLYNVSRLAVLGAVVLPPLSASPQIPEYGIQLIGIDPFDINDVIAYFNVVRSSVGAGPGVQVFYFPTFEQLESAQAGAEILAANGILISSPARWSSANSCYAHGWALGQLKFFAAEDIEDAFLAGDLRPEDILLTDAVPAGIPLLAGLVTLSPATPNSHVAILASTFQVPFAYFGVEADVQKAQSLVGRQVVLRTTAVPGFTGEVCQPDLIDVEDQLTRQQISEILALKIPPPLDLQPVASWGSYSANTNGLVQGDIEFFGGKAANYGILRRSIPAVCPLALGLSFDLWSEFLDQTLAGGMTLRQHIDAELAPYSFPPPDMQALADDLAALRALIRNTSATQFTDAQEGAIVAILQDPQYSFDPSKNIRFRSSTNVEDSAQFTGAGLYDSFSGCLLDDLDGDTSGPSICDPTETDERGVFRAIRRVFASFYNDDAFLARLRFNVDEHDVGMAMLVHHSFPDEIELANGVATYERGPFSITMTLVSQVGANAVTNPEPGQIPEEVSVLVFGTQFFPSVVTSSNLVLLGDTVMDWPDDYVQLAGLLKTAAERFELESGKTEYVLDFEYKKLAPGGGGIPGGGLEVDQIREIPQPDTTPNITPFLVNDPADYIVLQGGGGNVFANHRLKALWRQETRNMWLDPTDLAGQGIYAQTDITYSDGCSVAGLSGAMDGFPQYAHNFANTTEVDSWHIGNLPNPRTLALTTTGVGVPVSQAESPILTVKDLGPGNSGQLQLTANYDQPVVWYEYDFVNEQLVPVSGTAEQILLVPEFTDSSNDQLHTWAFTGPDGATITTTYYLHPVGGICAGCIFPVARWVETVIEGLTSEPIVLTGDFSQSYDAGQHNFSEWFLFEPRLDPGVSAQQLQELADQGVDQIVVYRSFSPDVVVYLSADACTCSAATGIAPCADVNSDGVRDDGCVWWACESGTCAGTDIVFADMGGEFGSCTPDGAADGNDRFHVLNCFANQDTAGAAGYPCEPTPPLALNVDAGGVFGNCSPDGVCDGHDAFHALNAFTGITTCSCPGGGPAPQPGPAPSSVQRAALRLAPPAQEAVGGDLVTVHAWLDSPLADLRGYQLHVAVSGGSAGTVQLVDIFMPEPGVFSSAGEPAKPGRSRSLRAPADEGTVDPGPGAWRAFNVQAGQMLAGLDGPGVSAGPGRLATFVLRVSADAAGTFAIELLADPGDAGQRTFLFPTPVGQGIDLEPGEPARIHVRPEGRD